MARPKWPHWIGTIQVIITKIEGLLHRKHFIYGACLVLFAIAFCYCTDEEIVSKRFSCLPKII